jgi:hypothetical protein
MVKVNRNRGSIKRNTGRETYNPPERLVFPEEVKQRFLDEGFYLRWIRYKIGNEVDSHNLSNRLREGYTLVKQDEAEDIIELLQLDTRSVQGAIMNGDLALAKIKIEKAEARQEYYEDLARKHEASYMRDVERQGDRRIPISNNSYSVSKTGRSAEFAKD